MADWSILLAELLHFISEKLPTATDRLRFRAVCATWRFAVPPPHAANRFPILPNSGISDTSWGFHLSRRTVYSIRSPIADCIPSWIIKLERDNPSRMHLLKPLSRARFKALPDDFPKLFNSLNLRVCELGEEYALQYINFRPLASSIGEAGNLYMEKVAVMNNNLDDGFVLLTIHVSGKLVVYKSGDEKWNVIDYLPSPYDDVILWKGNFYAVDNSGKLVFVDCENLNVNTIADSIFGGDKKFIVESNKELLLVDMYLSIGPADDSGLIEVLEFYEDFDRFMSERTVKFKVFRLDESVGWIEINDLGDRMLFLGENCTFSAAAAEIFPDGGHRGNCIFFTDQYYGREDEAASKARGIGVFDLGSGNIESIIGQGGYSKMFWPPPEWICSTTTSIEDGMNQLNV
ncbi:F-box protein SKIP23-like [Andrographis paniculata]|uniref:F-box protein SKIP23-like n=1 Tax=Andrographis paniculata TaxID=175694 RepID=UPI0021E90D57|nr:F-box protein SKIP23-like [Andrographis paniculata]